MNQSIHRRVGGIILVCLLLWALPVWAFSCAVCGQEIKRSYVEALGKYYHPEHFRCGGCGQPINGRFIPKDGVPYHRECYLTRFSPRCTICGKPIEGQYYQDYWGDRFHPEHKSNYPFCSTCGRPITQQTKGGVKLPDGRLLCGLCQSMAVFRQEDADRLAREARKILEKWGLRIPQENIPIVLEDRDQLRQNGMGEVTGLTKNLTRGKTRSIQAIHLLYGLPRPMFLGTIVHEYTHDWIFLTLPPMHRELAWEEGFCNYLSFLYYKTQGEPSAAYFVHCLEADPNPIYGEGFRRVRAIAERQGARALVELLKTQPDFPPGT